MILWYLYLIFPDVKTDGRFFERVTFYCYSTLIYKKSEFDNIVIIMTVVAMKFNFKYSQ